MASTVHPNLMVVMDMSSSLFDQIAYGSTTTKAHDLKQALPQLLEAGRGKVRFGLLPFPYDGACTVGQVEITCADDTVDPIASWVASFFPKGFTPTGASLLQVKQAPGMNDPDRNNFALLLTDGMPTCLNGNRIENDEQKAQAEAQATAAVAELYSAGIETFVVGLGEDLGAANPDLLNQMAEAGGWARPGETKYFQVNSFEELEVVLDEIGSTVISCSIRLHEVPENPAYLWVQFCDASGNNCALMQRDPSETDGWDYDFTRNQIHVYGETCQKLQDGRIPRVRVHLGCEPA